MAGAQTGYEIGRRAGPRLFNRPDSRLFRRAHVERAEAFFERNGAKTILLCRFVPVVRTFATVIAGVAKMDAWRFFVMNVLGALPWAVGVTLLGYALGKSIHNVDRYLLPIIGVIVVVSFVPVGLECGEVGPAEVGALELLRARRRAAAEPR